MKPRRHAAAAAALLLLAAAAAQAQNFTLEGAVIDSRSAQSLGVVSERGDINALLRAQKAVTFGILRSAGISLDQLPPDVRARVERFQTTNIEAFRAFSQGLDLKDQGRFVEAREQFRRAAALDPNFALAAEQQQAMPDVNLTSTLQTRAVLALAGAAAVDRGKATFVVDAARAAAAIAAGLNVVSVASIGDAQQQDLARRYSANADGSGAQFAPNLVAGLSYTYRSNGTELSIGIVNEYAGGRYSAGAGGLDGLGTAGEFQALRLNAPVSGAGSTTLSDGPAGSGTLAYWGRWNSSPGSSAVINIPETPAGAGSPAIPAVSLLAPALREVDYVAAEATRVMPTTGRPTFSAHAGAGNLGNVSGSITVDFVGRAVQLNNLGFELNGLSFSNLAGSASYADPAAPGAVASGAFRGNYSSGSCSGCAGFAPLSSAFGGNFAGRNANGLIFSTILLTGTGTASGVQLFTRPGP